MLNVVVWTEEGKSRHIIDSLFTGGLTQEQRDNVLMASNDMCETYMNPIGRHCRNATLVIDRVHASRALVGALVTCARRNGERPQSHGDRCSRGGLGYCASAPTAARKTATVSQAVEILDIPDQLTQG